MNRSLRLVTGQGLAKPGAHAALAMQLVAAARGLGLAVRSTRLGRCPGSPSRYVQLADRAGRLWIIRVSNHRRPTAAGHETPHFDLVSIDGVSGLDPAVAYLGEIAAGRAAWFDPSDVRQPRKRRRA